MKFGEIETPALGATPSRQFIADDHPVQPLMHHPLIDPSLDTSHLPHHVVTMKGMKDGSEQGTILPDQGEPTST